MTRTTKLFERKKVVAAKNQLYDLNNRSPIESVDPTEEMEMLDDIATIENPMFSEASNLKIKTLLNKPVIQEVDSPI